MTNTKMTKKEMFAILKEVVDASVERKDVDKEAFQKFLDHEIELLEKKSGKSSKTKTQKMNDGLVELIFKALEKEKTPVSVSELLGGHPELVNPETKLLMTNQKCSALVKKLVDAGRVVKTVEKRISKFSVKAEE